MRHSFGQAPRINEDQSRAMLPDQVSDAIIDIGPNRVCGHGAEFILRDFHGQIHLTLVPYIDDRAGSREG